MVSTVVDNPGSMNEDQILTKIALEAALAPLHPADREMMLLIYYVWQPEDWEDRPWPPRLEDIGNYIGLKWPKPGHAPAPLSEAAIRYRELQIVAAWQGKRGPLRRQRKKADL